MSARAAVVLVGLATACRPSAVATTGTTTVRVTTGTDAPSQLAIEPVPEAPLEALREHVRARCASGEMLDGVDVSSGEVSVGDARDTRVRWLRLHCVEVSIEGASLRFGASRTTPWRTMERGCAQSAPERFETLRCAERSVVVDASLDYAEPGRSPRRGLRRLTLHCANVMLRRTARGAELWGEESGNLASGRGADDLTGEVACGGVGADEGRVVSVPTGFAFVPEAGDESARCAVGPLCSAVSLVR